MSQLWTDVPWAGSIAERGSSTSTGPAVVLGLFHFFFNVKSVSNIAGVQGGHLPQVYICICTGFCPQINTTNKIWKTCWNVSTKIWLGCNFERHAGEVNAKKLNLY